MPLICSITTTWVEDEILEPVDTWVNEEQKKCSSKKWPANWFCWFVTVVVKVVIWVTRKVLAPVYTVTCNIVSWVVFGVLAGIAWVIDSVCKSCHTLDWVLGWLVTPTLATPLGTQPSITTPGEVDYTFECHCPKGQKVKIVVTAASQYSAAKQAEELCAANC